MTTLEKAARAVRSVFAQYPVINQTMTSGLQEELALELTTAVISAALLDPSDEEIDAALDALAKWKIAPPRTAVRAALRAAGVKITGSQG